MNQCPNCRENVLETATKCRHCGVTLDEKTFCLGEQEVLAEIQKARVEHAAKLQRLARAARLSNISGGLFAVGIGLAVLVVGIVPGRLHGLGFGVVGALLASAAVVLILSRKARSSG